MTYGFTTYTSVAQQHTNLYRLRHISLCEYPEWFSVCCVYVYTSFYVGGRLCVCVCAQLYDSVRADDISLSATVKKNDSSPICLYIPWMKSAKRMGSHRTTAEDYTTRKKENKASEYWRKKKHERLIRRRFWIVSYCYCWCLQLFDRACGCDFGAKKSATKETKTKKEGEKTCVAEAPSKIIRCVLRGRC